MRLPHAAAGLLILAAATPAAAQELNARVGKLESEMRAVQRKVFPDGAGKYLQPDIAPDQAPPAPAPGVAATSPVIDLSQRVAALESQMASLTGQVEQNGHQIHQLEDEFNAYRRATDAKLAAAAGAIDAGTPAGSPVGPSPRGDAGAAAIAPPPASRDGAPVAADAGGGPDRASRLAAIQKPSTGAPDEDAYLYGYRLYDAKLYPEAETQLKQVVADYPKSKRASYAQNLLGRAYLDDGKTNTAATAFYDSYKKFPDGERAPDSLFYLAGTLMKLDKPADACKVYSELTDVYGDKITPKMKADVAKGRVAARCK